MIAAGLSWRMAIGACVLGNTIMGLVITMNGRIGATVSFLEAQSPCTYSSKLTLVASYTISHSCTYAFWLLLQLLRSCIPMRTRHHLAWVCTCNSASAFPRNANRGRVVFKQ
jgi:hypothetical protein